MKTRKTKKRNIIRRTVAFLLCMTMVLGLGMQDVIEQVYAEEAIPVIEQEAATEEAGELTTEGAGPEENAETAEEPDESVEEAEEQPANSTPSQPADAEENTKTDVPSAPAENAGSEEGEKQSPSAPAEDGQSGSDSETSAETNPGGNTGNEITAPAEDGNTVTNPDETTGEDTEDDAAVSDEEEETTEPEEKVTELTYAAEDGSFSVTAAAVGEDTDLSSYELHAAQVQKDGEEADRYAAAEELVAGALDAESRRIEELQAYDIWFTYTESGETADLSGQVQISLEYTAPEFPEGTDVQFEVFCLNGGTAEAVDGTDALAAGCELYALAWAVPAGYDETWEDDQVIIRVAAEDGVLPAGAELSVTPIVKTEEEELANLSEEERAEAEAINEQYAQTEEKLTEDLKAQATEEVALPAAEADTAGVDTASDSEETADAATAKTLEGFLAYDISFLVNGEEVEPEGEVEVSFEFNEAVIPEGVSENAEVSVKHLKEDANAEDGIVVEDVTDNAEVKITESAEVQAMTFTTDSFSTFAITWSYGDNWWERLEITAYYMYIDEQGKLKEFTNADVSHGDISLEEGDVLNLYSEEYKQDIPGYVFQYITVDEANSSTHITALRTRTESVDRFNWYYIDYLKDGESDYTDWLSSEMMGDSSGRIYYIYQYQPSGLYIDDNLVKKGTLDAVYSADDGRQPVEYRWYRSESQDDGYTPVEEKNFQNNASNLTDDGSGLYPAYDKEEDVHIRYWYKVEAVFEDGTTVFSAPYQVPYYDELQNGSFETPAYRKYNNYLNRETPVTMSQVSNAAYKEEGIWQTTGTDNGKDIEILGVGEATEADGRYYDDGLSAFYAWQIGQTPNAADEVQFAELNCETAGALYQDVLTIPGQPLNYALSHRARGKYNQNKEFDTMFLVIMPTNESQDLITQEQLEYKLSEELHIDIDAYSASNEENEIVYKQDGILVARITSDDQNWHNIEMTNGYIPTSSVTRFFFVAGSTAASRDGDKKGNTIGNFLDDVWFSQALPPVADDEFSITIEKNFEGLDQTGIEAVIDNIQFVITAKQNGEELPPDKVAELLGRDSNILQGSDFTTTLEGVRFSIANQNIDGVYEITIMEQNADLSGFEMTSSAEATVTIRDAAQTPVQGNDSVTFTLQGDTTVDVVFTNTYESSENKRVSFTKVWDDDNDAFGTRPEKLEVTLKATVYVDKGTGPEKMELYSDDLGGVDLTKTLTGDNWTTFWDVPAYYDYQGAKVPIDYTVVEGTIDSSYVYEAEEIQEGDGTGYTGQFVSEGITVATDSSSINSAESTENVAGTAKLAADSQNAVTAVDSDNDLGTPLHNKYVEYNENTGDYTLNLDVTGAQGEATGVDVLFVIDTSGSMGGRYNSLLSQVKTLLTDNDGIIDQIFAGDGNVNSVAYVSFAGRSDTRASRWYQKSSSGSLKLSIDGLYATGGTNWTYAMQRASSVLAERADSGNEKVVIFLSDGEPTYSMEGNWQTGNGSSTRDSYYHDAANVVTGSDSLSQAKFYSVYLTSETYDGMDEFNDLLKKGNVDAELKNGVNLSDALTEILKTIIPTYKNVVITDTLSEYVDFVDKQITVTAKAADGTERPLSSGEYKVSVDGKTVSVTLLNGNSLTSGTTYTVSFRIKPNDTANGYYTNNNGTYPHEGDEGTGTTSAGKDGFYSNKEDSAKVTYTVNGEQGSADYPMPVVQVTTHNLTFEKRWNKPDSVEIPVDKVTLKVTYTDGTQDTVTLTEEENWTATINVPVTRRISTVVEEPVISDYTPSYQISDNGTKATVINNYSKNEKQDITVRKVWNGEGEKTPIQVALLQSQNDGEAEVIETVRLSAENGWSHTWDDMDLSKYEDDELVEYIYAVREVNTPAGWSSSISYEYKEGAIEAIITNTYDPNCADEQYFIANVLQTEELRISKTWEDNGNALGIRPHSLNVSVHDGTGGYYNVTLSANESWQKTLTILKKAGTNFTAKEQLENDTYYSQVGSATVTPDPNGVSISFVNKIDSKDIIVKKEWNDGLTGDDVTQIRPTSISFKLEYSADGGKNWYPYNGDTEGGVFTLTEEDIVYEASGNQITWAKKLSGLPASYLYRVIEVKMDENEPYESNVTEEDGTFTITNTLKWELKKTNMYDNSVEEKVLSGATFKLEDSNKNLIATGTSQTDGYVDWIPSVGVKLYDLNGSYTLTETAAPNGYQILQTSWTLTFANGLLTEASGEDGYGAYIFKNVDSTNGVVITVKNDELYELPETGGPGIHLYMLGGVALMMAGTLLVYKKRKEEVLRS